MAFTNWFVFFRFYIDLLAGVVMKSNRGYYDWLKHTDKYRTVRSKPISNLLLYYLPVRDHS